MNPHAHDDAKSDSEVENTTSVTSSSQTSGAIKMADKKVLAMSDFFKKTTIIDEEHQAYHDFG
jgi:hypothetical protein